MVYTKEQLEKMSDHEVNLAVVKKINFKFFEECKNPHFSWVEFVPEYYVDEDDNFSFEDYGSMDQVFRFDPCSNWNDVMPIAEKYGIGVMADLGNAWVEDSEEFHTEQYCENPRRAICEVLLMMEINND